MKRRLCSLLSLWAALSLCLTACSAGGGGTADPPATTDPPAVVTTTVAQGDTTAPPTQAPTTTAPPTKAPTTTAAAVIEQAVVYTADSRFVVGGRVAVADDKTRQAIMALGKSAAEYAAAQAGNLQYYWFRDDTYVADGPALTLTAADEGCRIRCRVYLFSDADRTQQCGVYDAAAVTVSAAPTKAPTTTVHVHEYDLPCSDTCVSCGAVREAPPHQYENDCDDTCDLCEAQRDAGHSVDDEGYCEKCMEYVG